LQDDADVHFTTPPTGFDVAFPVDIGIGVGVGFGVVIVLKEEDGVIVELAGIGRLIGRGFIPFVVFTLNTMNPSNELDGVNDAVFANALFKLGIVSVIHKDDITVCT